MLYTGHSAPYKIRSEIWIPLFIGREAGELIRLVASVHPLMDALTFGGVFVCHLTFSYWRVVVDCGSWLSQVQQKVQWNRSKDIYDNQSKVFVCVCYLLLNQQVGRLRSINLLMIIECGRSVFNSCVSGRGNRTGPVCVSVCKRSHGWTIWHTDKNFYVEVCLDHI